MTSSEQVLTWIDTKATAEDLKRVIARANERLTEIADEEFEVQVFKNGLTLSTLSVIRGRNKRLLEGLELPLIVPVISDYRLRIPQLDLEKLEPPAWAPVVHDFNGFMRKLCLAFDTLPPCNHTTPTVLIRKMIPNDLSKDWDWNVQRACYEGKAKILLYAYYQPLPYQVGSNCLLEGGTLALNTTTEPRTKYAQL